ncbi:hypothetical protein ACLSU7_08395 [Bdellovibrio sp. HCB185ZH]|uniref:hypothetical protein n=1 Tax=Bdellovibrio sp. HCB185ZH TaxID=3394235 RepID=UPI0039A53EAF
MASPRAAVLNLLVAHPQLRRHAIRAQPWLACASARRRGAHGGRLRAGMRPSALKLPLVLSRL